jgi:hypothetical protein
VQFAAVQTDAAPADDWMIDVEPVNVVEPVPLAVVRALVPLAVVFSVMRTRFVDTLTVDVWKVRFAPSVIPVMRAIVGVSFELAQPVSPIRMRPAELKAHTVIGDEPEYVTFWLKKRSIVSLGAIEPLNELFVIVIPVGTRPTWTIEKFAVLFHEPCSVRAW